MKRFLTTIENAALEAYVSPKASVVNLDPEGILCNSINALDIESFDIENYTNGSVVF